MKISINSIKLQTIYIQLDKYLENNPDILNLIDDLDLHPFNNPYYLPPEHFIPNRFANIDALPNTYFSTFINSFRYYFDSLNETFYRLNNSQPEHPESTAPMILSTYIAYYLRLLTKYLPAYF